MLGLVERNSDMRLGSKVVDLVRLDAGEQGNESCTVAQIAVMQKKPCIWLVGIDIQMLNTSGIEG
jgi:hypothetical protein